MLWNLRMNKMWTRIKLLALWTEFLNKNKNTGHQDDNLFPLETIHRRMRMFFWWKIRMPKLCKSLRSRESLESFCVFFFVTKSLWQRSVISSQSWFCWSKEKASCEQLDENSLLNNSQPHFFFAKRWKKRDKQANSFQTRKNYFALTPKGNSETE